jgi:hypothetical protein
MEELQPRRAQGMGEQNLPPTQQPLGQGPSAVTRDHRRKLLPSSCRVQEAVRAPLTCPS